MVEAAEELQALKDRISREWARRFNAEFSVRLRRVVGGSYNMTWVTKRARRHVAREVTRDAPPDPDSIPLFAHLWPLWPKKWAGGDRSDDE
jgi:hypothetical protein